MAAASCAGIVAVSLDPVKGKRLCHNRRDEREEAIMPKWRFWERPPEPSTTPTNPPRRTAPAGEIIRPEPPVPQSAAADPQRLATLKRRRETLVFDVEQSELAAQPENPWRERIALLNETIANVSADLAALTPPRLNRPAFPPKPVAIDEVRWEDPASVSFTIDSETFRYTSEIDWAERGTYVSRNELALQAGKPATLVPETFPPELMSTAQDRLTEALFIFASDLRHRAESDQPLPTNVTLDSILSICPECGDWQAWGGYCPTCTALAQQRQALTDEMSRLGDEARQEEEERAKLADRLGVARRRLAETESEIARIESSD
jgi:hypothetical protein